MNNLADDQAHRRAIDSAGNTATSVPPGDSAPPLSVSKRAAVGAGWIIAWRVASRNLGLVNTLVLVRLLQPSDFGLIALATSFIASVDALSALGVQDALLRAKNPDRAMYDTAFSMCVLRSVMTAGIVAAIAWPVGTFFEDERLTIVMLALSVGTLMGGLENIGIVDFRRHMMFEKDFIINVGHRVTGVVVTIAVAVIWRSYWALIIGLLAARFIRLPLTYTMSRYRPRLSLRAWRSLIGFSLWAWAQSLLFQVRERSDSIIVGRFLGATQVGILTVGLELGLLPVTELVQPLSTALFPGFASLHNRTEGVGNLFLNAVGAGYALVFPAGLGISMVADPMVRMALGTSWDAAVPVIQIMALSGSLGLLGQVCATVLNAIGRPHTTFHIAAVTTVLKIPALWVMVAYYGLVGAAIALAGIGLIDFVLFAAITLPRIGVSLGQLIAVLLRPTAAGLVMVLVLSSMGMAWTPAIGPGFADATWDALTRVAAGAAAYSVALSALWFAAGRPDGAEAFLWNLTVATFRKSRRLVRP